MKVKLIIILLLMMLVGTACERTLEFDDPTQAAADDMAVNAIAVAGTPFKVYLNHVYLVNKIPPMQYYGSGSSIQMKDDGSFDYRSNEYYQRTAISDASIEITVNEQTKYQMSYDEDNFSYVCNYVPDEGDHVEVNIIAGEQEVHAETDVPSKPKIEIISHEVIPENPYSQMGNLTSYSDTIMQLTCRISDIGGEQYYRLRVRSERTSYDRTSNGDYVYYTMQDVFFSDDELFVDKRLSSNFGGWQAYFSNVFDNTFMKGKTYSFTLDSPKAGNHSFTSYNPFSGELSKDGEIIPSRVMVELQAISPELYKYLKSMQLYRISPNDGYAEPVQIYSNVQNGWGIFGALSYDRHFVEFGE
ncbi:MAG: DUF4249 family protein [Bacteroidaceae bacterium]|nr:DUF4249 family protein [Bacteroidaceae bacterium]